MESTFYTIASILILSIVAYSLRKIHKPNKDHIALAPNTDSIRDDSFDDYTSMPLTNGGHIYAFKDGTTIRIDPTKERSA
jgi:hypothetical protein